MNLVSLVSSVHKQGRNEILTRGSADNLNTQKGYDHFNLAKLPICVRFSTGTEDGCSLEQMQCVYLLLFCADVHVCSQPRPLLPPLGTWFQKNSQEWSAHPPKYHYLQEMMLDLFSQSLDVAEPLQWSESTFFFRSWSFIVLSHHSWWVKDTILYRNIDNMAQVVCLTKPQYTIHIHICSYHLNEHSNRVKDKPIAFWVAWARGSLVGKNGSSNDKEHAAHCPQVTAAKCQSSPVGGRGNIESQSWLCPRVTLGLCSLSASPSSSVEWECWLPPTEGQVEESLMRDLAAVDSCPVENSMSWLAHISPPLRDISGSHQEAQRIDTHSSVSFGRPPCVVWGPLIVFSLLTTT